MPLFTSRVRPRLAPELDDRALGVVLQRLSGVQARTQHDLVVPLLEHVIHGARQDWDRKMHRIKVLAETLGQGATRTWMRYRPDDPGALLLQGWSDLVTLQAAPSFTDSTGIRALGRRAAELLPEDPLPWVLLLGVLRLERRPPREVDVVWREIRARDPWNREAHLQILAYSSPQECGSTARMMDLLDEMRAAMPAGAPTTGLEVTVLVQRYQRALAAEGLTALSSRDLLNQPAAARALARSAALWPQKGFLTHAAALADLNTLAYALVKAARAEEAAAVVRATKGLATRWPWHLDGDPLERFTRAYRTST
ncbi:hypothetical protein ACIRD3_07295 [Kitasatospora sp. NPDC093550]|uniref:hypothetical protein n=1 Tax=Kitasatospora sp. NPDC093550 TaxID=3364089 RepID=UPI00380A783A